MVHSALVAVPWTLLGHRQLAVALPVQIADHISPKFASLGNYLRSHNMQGDKVKIDSAESL